MESPGDGCEEGGKDVGRVDCVDGEDVEDVGLVHGVGALCVYECMCVCVCFPRGNRSIYTYTFQKC